MSEYGAVLELY